MTTQQWEGLEEGGYQFQPNWWCFYQIVPVDDDRWKWYEFSTDEWNAETMEEYTAIVNESDGTFATWQEAAADCEKYNNL